MNTSAFISLYEKYLRGECTPAELDQLASFQDELKLAGEEWKDPAVSEEEVYQRIWTRLEKSRSPLPAAAKTWSPRWMSYAAALLLLAGGASWFFITAYDYPGKNKTAAVRPKKTVIPGGNKAALTLADGTVITLDSAANGKIALESGVTVTKNRDGMLIYRSARGDRKELSAGGAENTISTPRGGQYELVLSDGTKVWLNAASSLKFPAHFDAVQRQVTLSGEAYFEVRKNPSAPFVVSTPAQQIRVLGTHFNVRAYSDDLQTRTSLLEGRVTVSSSGKSAMLVPGQEGVNRPGAPPDVRQADVEKCIAWKNGLFEFEDASIQEVMQQVSRWYDIAVIYKGEVPVRQFTGTISRKVSIDRVISMLQYSGLELQLRGDQLLVSAQ